MAPQDAEKKSDIASSPTLLPLLNLLSTLPTMQLSLSLSVPLSASVWLSVRGRWSFSFVGGSVCTNALVFTSWRYRKCVWRMQEVTHVWSSTAPERQPPPPSWTSRVRRPIRFNLNTPDRIIWYIAEWIFVSCFCPQVFLRTPPGESLSDCT